jgi:hypothetical protein
MALSTDDSRHVVAALEKATSLNVKDLSSLVAAAVPSLKSKDSREIVGTLLSLYSARTGMDMPVDLFVTELLTAAPGGKTAATLPPETLQKNLRDLLSVRPLSMIAKARRIHTDHERTFCTVRVLTDMRPVFDADVKEEPVGFVLVHLLKIGYHHAGRHTNLHIAMDKVDIDNLMSALQRAKDKATTLIGVTKKCGFSILAD